MSLSNVQDIVCEYKKGLEKILGDQIISVILYGSRARGDAAESSDIDLLCVLRNPYDCLEMIRQTSALTARLSLEHDVVLSRVFVSERDYQTNNLPFFMNIRREGVPV